MDKGRIRLSALSRSERILAVAGMAMLGVLSVIMLRPGPVPDHLLQLYSGVIPESIPTALPALLLVGLCFSWVLLVCGSLSCHALIPAGLAGAFLLANAEVAEVLRVLQPGFGTSLVITGYLLAPAGLLAYSVLLTGRYRSKSDSGRLRIASGTGCLTGVVLFYGAVLGIYVHGRARPDQGRLAFAMALIALTWLVSSDGEFLDLIGRVLRLSANVPLVFGLLLVLLGGSQFTRAGNNWLPERARPLLWIGYLSLSLLLSFWITFSTGLPIIGDEFQLDLSYFFLLIAPPLAAWLVLTGRFSEKNPPRPTAGDGPAAAPATGGEAA